MNILFIVYQFSLESTKLKIKFSISIIIRKKSQKNQCLLSPLLSGLFLSESYLSQMLYSTIPSTLTYIIYVPKTCKYNDFDIFSWSHYCRRPVCLIRCIGIFLRFQAHRGPKIIYCIFYPSMSHLENYHNKPEYPARQYKH